MATKSRKRNTAGRTALVFNPAGRSLSVGGSRVTNPHKRRHHKAQHSVRKVMAHRRNPKRRKSNPATVSGLLIASVMTGLTVSLFDIVTTKFVPASAMWRIGVKAGGAWLFQSPLGAKIPVLGKYRQEAALVLGVAAFVDVFKLVVLPLIAPTLEQVGLLPASPQLVAIDDGTTGNIYGTSYSPDYVQYS